MLKYALKRVLLGFLAIIGVSIIIFVATRLSGDVTFLMIPHDAKAEDIIEMRTSLGLDDPLPVQYFIFIKNVFRGDFGTSLWHKLPAMELVLDRLPATVQLAVTGFLISVIIGLPIGVLAARNRGTWIDKLATTLSLSGQAMPGFWVAIMMMLLFAVTLGWLPTSGKGGIEHIIMPAFSLSLYSFAAILRLTRSGMVEALDNEYIKLARLKGNPEWVVAWKHALRNALIPVVTMSGMQLAMLMGGTVIIESIFAWPGIGKLILDAIYDRDYPIVQAGVFITSTIFVFTNLVVDLLYGIIDPRIRY
jgi:peptide/nickel transport system permease protein